MDEHELRRSVEQARRELGVLRASLAASGIESASPETGTGLCSIEETLAKLQAHCALLRDILEKADAAFARHQDGHHAATIHAERLRSMTLASLLAEEDQRRSLAGQLQSSLGQDIALVKMRLAALRHATTAQVRASLLETERLVEEVDRAFRSVTFQISPLILYDLGLVPAIEWLAEDVRDRFGIELWIADDGQVEPPDDTMRVIVFRVVRELVNRAARQGGAGQSVWLRHHGDAKQLRITIECGWCWLEAGAEAPAEEGLFHLRHQLRHVHGELHVDLAGDRGTTVTVTAQLAG